MKITNIDREAIFHCIKHIYCWGTILLMNICRDMNGCIFDIFINYWSNNNHRWNEKFWETHLEQLLPFILWWKRTKNEWHLFLPENHSKNQVIDILWQTLEYLLGIVPILVFFSMFLINGHYRLVKQQWLNTDIFLLFLNCKWCKKMDFCLMIACCWLVLLK